MSPGRQLHRLLLGVAITTAAVVLGAAAAGWLDGAELSLVDARFEVRGDRAPRAGVVVVAIDDASLQAIDEYPFRRRVHARMLDRLREAGAAVIGYDVVFAEQTNEEDDGLLLEAIDRADDVVLAATETADDGTPNVLGGDPGAFGATAGSANYPLDRGGVIRRVAGKVEGLESFPLAIVRQTGARVPSVPGGGAPIDYAGPRRTYPHLSFTEVLAGKHAATLRDAIVIVGATQSNLQDVHPTPTDAAMAGSEIAANAVDTALRDLPLSTAPGWVRTLLVLLLAAVAPLAASHRGRWWTTAAATAAAFVLVAGGGVLAFTAGGLELPLAAPLLALGLALPPTLLVAGLVVQREHAEAMAGARIAALDAAAQARRHVERDLHDGAQQQMIGLVYRLRAARAKAKRQAPEDLDGLLGDVEEQLLASVESLRALARGVSPAQLADRGLDAALEALVARLPRHVEVVARADRRFGPSAEAVAYFVASEGIANALKHAGASRITVAAHARGDDALELVVADDGAGGADPASSGLAGLRERVEERGGTFTVASPPGGGTTLRALLPNAA